MCRLGFYTMAMISLLLLISCEIKDREPVVSAPLSYKALKDSLQKIKDTLPDSSNPFDATSFDPGKDSIDAILKKIRIVWKNDLDTTKKSQAIISKTDSTIARLNLEVLDSFLAHHEDTVTGCRESECLLYAEVIKSRQMLYLHFDGELVDSFKVSTGLGKKYRTPSFSVRPSGPLFIKYTSRKFPGGNYLGLGNMPFVVFVKGGYAIHGTTPGNFSKLGKPASHGCIRLHPDNARIFFGIVKRIGLKNVWVNVRDSL